VNGDLIVKGNLKVGGSITVLGTSKSQQTLQSPNRRTSVLEDINFQELLQPHQSNTKLTSNNDIDSNTNANNQAYNDMDDNSVPRTQKTVLDHLQFGINQPPDPGIQSDSPQEESDRPQLEEHIQSQKPSHRTRNFIIREPTHQSSIKPIASCTTLTESCSQCSSVSATCMNNEVRTGGGCNVTPSKYYLSGNYPDKDNLSWRCMVQDSVQVDFLEAFVICCR